MTHATESAIVPRHPSMSGREFLLFHAKDKGKGGLLSRNPWRTFSLERMASRTVSLAVPEGC